MLQKFCPGKFLQLRWIAFWFFGLMQVNTVGGGGATGATVLQLSHVCPLKSIVSSLRHVTVSLSGRRHKMHLWSLRHHSPDFAQSRRETQLLPVSNDVGVMVGEVVGDEVVGDTVGEAVGATVGDADGD